MNNLEKQNLLQFIYIFKFQFINIILISYIIELIYEFKTNNNYNF